MISFDDNNKNNNRNTNENDLMKIKSKTSRVASQKNTITKKKANEKTRKSFIPIHKIYQIIYIYSKYMFI